MEPEPRFTYAGFWLRLVAYIIDAIILLFISLLIVLLDLLLLGTAADEVSAAGNLLSGVAGWLYYALSESSGYRATLGKRVMELEVTDLQGGQLTFLRATGRHFGKILSTLPLLVGWFMAGFTEKKQALHDILASTLVIRKDK